MGQKVHPFGFRLGIFEDWNAHWFAKKSYGKELKEDMQIREYLSKALDKSEVAKIVIDKAGEGIKVTILEQKESWVYVRLSNSLIGWIPTQMLERI